MQPKHHFLIGAGLVTLLAALGAGQYALDRTVAAQAKAARRTFAGGQTWIARGELDDLYARNDAQHRAIRNALAARSAAGARALATEHVHSSYELLLAILDHVDRQAVTLRRTSA